MSKLEPYFESKLYFNKNFTCISYDDANIVPMRSDIPSRKADSGYINTTVNMLLKDGSILELKHPIVPSNMESIMGPEMVWMLAHTGGLPILPRYGNIERFKENVYASVCKLTTTPNPVLGISIGTRDAINVKDLESMAEYLNMINTKVDTRIRFVITIEVAHGHHDLVKDAAKKVREIIAPACKHPIVLAAGAIATYDAAQFLVNECGADILSVGVGPGCFIPGTLVNTETGVKPIEHITIGERVFTHTGELKPVRQLHTYERDEQLVEINGVTSTANHEYYVVNVENAAKVNDVNIHQYAYWVSASDLDMEKHLLLELENI